MQCHSNKKNVLKGGLFELKAHMMRTFVNEGDLSALEGTREKSQAAFG
jgi:hypothetical protein